MPKHKPKPPRNNTYELRLQDACKAAGITREDYEQAVKPVYGGTGYSRRKTFQAIRDRVAWAMWDKYGTEMSQPDYAEALCYKSHNTIRAALLRRPLAGGGA